MPLVKCTFQLLTSPSIARLSWRWCSDQAGSHREPEAVMYALNGRIGLVTGGGGGIGREIARRLAREGMAVEVLDRDDQAAQAVAAEIDGLAVAADVTSPEALARAVDATLARFGKIDVLVNNAGIAWTGPALEMPLEVLQAML